MDTSSSLQLTGRYWRAFPPADPLGPAEEPLSLPVDETVFLLIDVYGKRYDDPVTLPDGMPDFYRPGLVDPFREIVRHRIVPAKAAAKRAGIRVVYTTNYLSPGLSEANEWRRMSVRTCGVDVLEAWRPPTPILEHASVIAPGPHEPVILKQQYSGFFETNLDSVLRGYGAKSLVAVGFDSRICLAATLTDALFRDYRVVALRDAIGTVEYPETAHEGWASFMAVRFIESNIGYTATTDDFIAACDAIADGRAASGAPRRGRPKG
ncbi:MAG: isochorismatase family protein [Chloroflexi bacterium]|nr:isochorismatase family protein [Chloroflexota bacterium]